jgi:hypothetical protein
MNCQKCESDRILEICGKTRDLCWASFKDQEQEQGYVPCGFNVDDGTGDYLEFALCLQCGQVQGKWPVKKNPKLG